MTNYKIKDLISKFLIGLLLTGMAFCIIAFGYILIVQSDWKVDRVSLAAVLEQNGGTITNRGETIPLDYITRNFYFNITSYNMRCRALNKKAMEEQEDSIVIDINNCKIIINSALSGYGLNLTWFDGERTRSYTVNCEMKFATCETQFYSSKIAHSKKQ